MAPLPDEDSGDVDKGWGHGGGGGGGGNDGDDGDGDGDEPGLTKRLYAWPPGYTGDEDPELPQDDAEMADGGGEVESDWDEGEEV